MRQFGTIPRSHLIVLDVQPLFGGDADYRAKYTRPIAQFLQAHQPYLSWGGDFIEESQQLFPRRRCCGLALRKRKL